MLSTCAAVRVFLFGMLSLVVKVEVGELLVWMFGKVDVEVVEEVELRVPDFLSDTSSHRGGGGGVLLSSGLRGAKPSVVAAYVTGDSATSSGASEMMVEYLGGATWSVGAGFLFAESVEDCVDGIRDRGGSGGGISSCETSGYGCG
jgi:hypothetical protein